MNLAALSSGLSFGYSAIAVPQLTPTMDHDDYDIYRPFTVTEEEGSWIGEQGCIYNKLAQVDASSSYLFSASIFGIGAIFGGFSAGILGSRIGRRKTLMALAIPDILGWVLIAAAQNLPMMLLGRFLCGFAAAGYTPSIQAMMQRNTA